MGFFSERSRERLWTCHTDLIDVMEIVVLEYDCKILCGHRGEREQNLAFKAGLSHTSWPNSKHNQIPSQAVDVFPIPAHGWPIREEDWNDTERFRRFAHFVLGVACGMNIDLRWGGDWDQDWDVHDNRFNDLVHFERTGWPQRISGGG